MFFFFFGKFFFSGYLIIYTISGEEKGKRIYGFAVNGNFKWICLLFFVVYKFYNCIIRFGKFLCIGIFSKVWHVIDCQFVFLLPFIFICWNSPEI